VRTIFWQGFLSDVLNSKVAIFSLAFLPQFVNVKNHDVRNGATAAARHYCNMVAISINLTLVYFAGAATAKLRQNDRVVAWLNKAMGAVFIVLGLRLAQER
jgi:threonine/homoserine/homoserine lactone efflux protein